jgi:hypothetical protein
MHANPSMIFSFDLNEFFKKIVQYSIFFSPYVLIKKHGNRHCGWLGRSQPGKQKQTSNLPS